MNCTLLIKSVIQLVGRGAAEWAEVFTRWTRVRRCVFERDATSRSSLASTSRPPEAKAWARRNLALTFVGSNRTTLSHLHTAEQRQRHVSDEARPSSPNSASPSCVHEAAAAPSFRQQAAALSATLTARPCSSSLSGCVWPQAVPYNPAPPLSPPPSPSALQPSSSR